MLSPITFHNELQGTNDRNHLSMQLEKPYIGGDPNPTLGLQQVTPSLANT